MDEIEEEIVFERTCRTCLEQDTNQEFLPLFKGSLSCKATKPEILDEVLFFNLGLWENDGLPQQMCLNCVDIFSSCSEFRKQCNEVQDKLAAYHALGRVNAEKVEVKIEKIEFIDVEQNEKTTNDNESILNFVTDNSKDNEDNDGYVIETLTNEENEEIENENTDDCANSNNTADVPAHISTICKFCKQKFPRKISRAEHIRDCPDRNVELCEYCTGEFETTALLEEHKEKIHKDNKDPMCPICHRTFSNYSSRNAHVINYHSGKPEKYECNTCNGSFRTKASLRNHILCYHKPTKYQCAICQKQLRNIFRYRYHMKTHGAKKHQCQYCDKKFVQIGWKQKHELTHSNDQPPDNGPDQSNNAETTNDKANVPTERKYYSCKYCRKRFFRTKIEGHQDTCPKRDSNICELCTDEFKSIEELEAHTEEIHKDDKRPSCNICYRKFTGEIYRKAHIRTYHSDKEQQFLCKICGRASRTKTGLNNHMRRIHSETKYQCSLCPKQLNNVFQYKYHMKAHNPKKKFQCQYCDKSFMQIHHKQNHENTHTGERPHLCNVCGKCYRSDQELHYHLVRFHNGGEKVPTARKSRTPLNTRFPFNCTRCSKGFLVAYALARHLKTHTDKDRKHVCEQCGQAFKRIAHLTSHVKRLHLNMKSIKCDFCNKLFLTMGDRRAHMVTHRDEKPFKCSYCPKTYKWKNLLIEHERLHTGEMPYQCEICFKRFALRGGLSVHTLSEHSEIQQKILEENILQGLVNPEENYVEIDVES